MRAEGDQEVRSDMGSRGESNGRYSSRGLGGDNSHVAGVEMEKMGPFPLRTDEVSSSADEQPPPHFMSPRLSFNKVCFDN